jgi:archaetidylinositol phosphate synthase
MQAGDTAGLTRANSGWLAKLEARALAWLAPRVPLGVTPDQLTALGLAASAMALAAYILSRTHPGALWLVNLALIINWLGDSLDGHVARLRRIERPRYGLFLDQSVDILSQFLFTLGLAASGLVEPTIVAFGFAAYLMMTAQSLLRAEATRVFHLATGGMGLTEVRCQFLLANALFFFVPPRPFTLAGVTTSYADLLGLLWIAVTIVLYVASMTTQLRKLAELEPRADARRHIRDARPDATSPRSD